MARGVKAGRVTYYGLANDVNTAKNSPLPVLLVDAASGCRRPVRSRSLSAAGIAW